MQASNKTHKNVCVALNSGAKFSNFLVSYLSPRREIEDKSCFW